MNSSNFGGPTSMEIQGSFYPKEIQMVPVFTASTTMRKSPSSLSGEIERGCLEGKRDEIPATTAKGLHLGLTETPAQRDPEEMENLLRRGHLLTTLIWRTPMQLVLIASIGDGFKMLYCRKLQCHLTLSQSKIYLTKDQKRRLKSHWMQLGEHPIQLKPALDRIFCAMHVAVLGKLVEASTAESMEELI